MSGSVSQWLREHPGLQFIDLLMTDLNGILRGKKIHPGEAGKVFADGMLLPRSVYGTDVCGDTVDATGLGIASGDRDYVCRPEPATLRETPWRPGAQCIVEMQDDDGAPFAASPRQVLKNVVAGLARQGLYATVAVELEFYLFRDRLDAAGKPQLLRDPVTGEQSRSTQVYSMGDLEAQAPFIDAVRRYCDRQQVPASAAVAEYAPGQFEINLGHRPDPVAACDDAIYLKRIIRFAAREHGLLATFMAKPVEGITGSGTHIHVSINDADGNNVFAHSPAQLEHAVGGLQQTMADLMLVLAPHANSFRRFRRGFYVPMSPTWGYNNRSVALRIPAGPDHARRIEHRVAGADANPYLVMAGVLAGIGQGIAQQATADAPIEGNAADQREPDLPTDWWQAINRFEASSAAQQIFGETLHTLYTSVKKAEYEAYQRRVPPLDIEWYLQVV